MSSDLTRRKVLQGAALVGATAVAAPGSLVCSLDAEAATPAEKLTQLTAREAQLLEAIVDRLIPGDALGPGAKQAGVVRYIDRALGDALASSREAYAVGLEALDRYARASRRSAFLELPPIDQDSVLIDVETGGARGFPASSAQFFAMILTHTRQGMFGDPSYGGNANFAGWDLIGYPGVRTAVSPSDQKALEAGELKANHRGAYDYRMFERTHGD